MEKPILNAHNKAEYEPAHTAEHILEQVAAIEAKVNEIIQSGLDVNVRFVSRQEAASLVDLSKLPEDASQTLRIVGVGSYDDCACIGAHVSNTREIGVFKILSHDF